MPYDPRYGLVPEGWTGPQAPRGLNQYGPGAQARGYNTYGERLDRDRRVGRNALLRSAVLPVAVAGGAAAAPFLFGGAGAAGAAGGAASTVPAATAGAVPAVTAAAGRFTLPNILRMAEIGVPAVTGIFANRAQNRALDRQSVLEQQNLEAQMAYARELEAQRRAEAERMFMEDQRRWEAEERNRARELASSEEERAYNRRLMEERETRRAPYRQLSQDALYRLSDMLRLGRR